MKIKYKVYVYVQSEFYMAVAISARKTKENVSLKLKPSMNIKLWNFLSARASELDWNKIFNSAFAKIQ